MYAIRRLSAARLTALALAYLGIAQANTMCPDGQFHANGVCRICPDGSYTTAPQCVLAPNGQFVPGYGGGLRMTPNGNYIPDTGHMVLCPNGAYLPGTRCRLMPDGRYIGEQ